MSAINRFVGWLTALGLWMSALMLLAVVTVVSLEVFCRTFLGTSLFVVEEMVGYLLSGFTMFGLAYAIRAGRVLRVEILYQRLKPTHRTAAQLIFDIAALGYMIILEYQLIRLVFTSYSRHIVSVTISSFPVWIPQTFVAIGGMLLVLTLINAILQDGRAALRRAGPATS